METSYSNAIIIKPILLSDVDGNALTIEVGTEIVVNPQEGIGAIYNGMHFAISPDEYRILSDN